MINDEIRHLTSKGDAMYRRYKRMGKLLGEFTSMHNEVTQRTTTAIKDFLKNTVFDGMADEKGIWKS